jgi:hypothetical protein
MHVTVTNVSPREYFDLVASIRSSPVDWCGCAVVLHVGGTSMLSLKPNYPTRLRLLISPQMTCNCSPCRQYGKIVICLKQCYFAISNGFYTTQVFGLNSALHCTLFLDFQSLCSVAYELEACPRISRAWP